jgi:hypothetical protein
MKADELQEGLCIATPFDLPMRLLPIETLA